MAPVHVYLANVDMYLQNAQHLNGSVYGSKISFNCKFSFMIWYFVTFCLHAAKKDFDIIVSFGKLKSIIL